jgi:hypothetical protein
MMKLIALLLAITVIGSGQSARVLTRGEATQIIIPAPKPRLGISLVPPVWSGGALLSVIVNDTPQPALNVTHADGRNEEVRFRFPDWTNFVVVGLTGREDGEIVTGGFGDKTDGRRSGFVVRIGKNRASTLIPVDAILIGVMTVGPGEVIWAVGSGHDKETDEVHNNIPVRLSPAGKLLSSTILEFPGDPSGRAFGSQMRASSDRIAWLTTRNDYIEYSSSGSELTHVAGPEADNEFGQALALSEANTVMIGKTTKPTRAHPNRVNIYSLDRIKQEWFLSEMAGAPIPAGTSVYGFDGPTLMTGGRDRTLGQVLVRYTLSETK